MALNDRTLLAGEIHEIDSDEYGKLFTSRMTQTGSDNVFEARFSELQLPPSQRKLIEEGALVRCWLAPGDSPADGVEVLTRARIRIGEAAAHEDLLEMVSRARAQVIKPLWD